VIVRARTTWAILARNSLRPMRVPKDVLDRFFLDAGGSAR
jgi:hypothetical protein